MRRGEEEGTETVQPSAALFDSVRLSPVSRDGSDAQTVGSESAE
jgi:hypothetical protein